MSITYEEALSTLEAMFGSPWTRETLDLVLRHYEGHMENTVESVLGHGDGDPKVLLDRLKSGATNTADVSMDEQLALQLANEEQRRQGGGGGRIAGVGAVPPGRSIPATGGASSSPPPPKGCGTPTQLPSDFLRIPGYSTTTAGGGASAGANNTTDDDERLARMLQDELFSQELARNPQFAHLARGRPRTVGGMPTGNTNSRVAELPSASRTSHPPRRHGEGPSIEDHGRQVIEKIGEMGTDAKKKLQLFAANFNANRLKNLRGGRGGDGGGGGAASSGTHQESRGLLDGDDIDDGFGNSMEMGGMGFGSKKTM